MDRDSVVVGGIYRTTALPGYTETYTAGSIVRVTNILSFGASTELLIGDTKHGLVQNFVFFTELEELE